MILKTEIEKLQKRLKMKVKQKGIYENFGQREVRALEDKFNFIMLRYGNEEDRRQAEEINRFREWCENYTG